MSKYKAYPEYKDSWVESLDNIPKMWSIKKLKYIFEIKKKIAGKIGYDVLSVTQKGIKIKDIESGEGQLSMDYSKYQRVYPGEFAMNHMDLLTGYVDISNYDGVTSPDYRVFAVRNKHSFYSRYYLYLLQDGYKQRRFFHLGQGSAHLGRWRLPTEAFNEIVYPCPSLKEQIKIASFLDHETAKIDNLIEKQQQLIELLKEKRQAVISHAVTKGLNPDVPMKDSGVEWLGEVPEHWELVPLKYLCNFSGGGTPTKDNLSYWQGGTVPWVSPKDMKSFWISETQDYVTPKAVSESSTNYVEEGSLLMVVRSGILQRNIPVAINIVKITINQDMKALRFNERMKAHYAAYFINGNVKSLLLEWTKEGATVESIEHEFLANGLIPVPPIDEQHSIIKRISDQMKRFESLEENALTGIRLLQERRTALISAAVTGKIDVRDWVAPETSESEVSQEATA
ncbi:restriction endonuclease subunit S [Dryocola sp. LX212]